MQGCKVHDPVEPLPEGEGTVGQRLPAELGPGDHQVLDVVLTQVRVPAHKHNTSTREPND